MSPIILLLITTIGFEHMSVDPVAHRVGMGYAQFGDGYSVHYNPGGLAYGIGTFYSASYLNYIGGTHFGYIGYENNQVGVGIRYFNGGTIKRTDELGFEDGTFSVHFIDMTIGKGLFFNDIGLGIALKGVYARIDTLSAIGIGADIGGIYIIPDPEIQIGLAIKNIGTGVKAYIDENETLPYEINLGVTKQFADGWVGFDLVKPALMDFGIRIGGSFSVTPLFDLKASYNSLLSSIRTGNNGLDFLAGVTAGFALNTGRFCIDYSYSPYFDLGGCHRLS
ncbi:MAG: hypothetical protein JSW02_04700, partial [candidate division WOR-3 bacterium]